MNALQTRHKPQKEIFLNIILNLVFPRTRAKREMIEKQPEIVSRDKQKNSSYTLHLRKLSAKNKLLLRV